MTSFALQEAVGPLLLTSGDALPKHFKLDPHRVDQNQSVCVSGSWLDISSQNGFLFNQLGFRSTKCLFSVTIPLKCH